MLTLDFVSLALHQKPKNEQIVNDLKVMRVRRREVFGNFLRWEMISEEHSNLENDHRCEVFEGVRVPESQRWPYKQSARCP